MKILMVSGYDHIGGDVKMYFLAPAELTDRDEFDVHVAAPRRGLSSEHLRSLPHITLHEVEMASAETTTKTGRFGRAFEAGIALLRLVWLVLTKRIDAIFTLDRGISMRLSYYVSRITRRPLIFHMHHVHYLETEPFWRTVIAHSSAISVTSDWMRGHLDPHLSAGTEVMTTKNAIRIADYDPTIDGVAVRAELGIGVDAPVVTIAGRLAYHKGHIELLEAVAALRDEFPDIQVLVPGIPDLESQDFPAQVEARAAELGLSDIVHLLGWRGDIDRLFAASTVVTMPSYTEMFGLVAAEAMAMQRPVVATDAGGVPEFIDDGVTGYLIPPRDAVALEAALRRVLADPEGAAEVAARGRAYAEAHLDYRPYAESIYELWRTQA